MNFEEKVSYEVAEKEVHEWLASKKVRASKITNNPEAIESLIDGIRDGIIVIEGGELRQTLVHPPTGTEGTFVKELIFKNRFTVQQAAKATDTLKAGDSNGRMVAYVSLLTGVSKGLLSKLDMEDFHLSIQIAVFFI